MSTTLFSELLSLSAGALLLTAALIVWRHSLTASIQLLAVQGVALASLVAVIGLYEQELELLVVAALVLVLKGGVLPSVLWYGASVSREQRDASRLNPTAALLFVVLLTALAYVITSPLLEQSDDAATKAVPVGVALVLIGFLQLVTRGRALSQLVGFLMLDNGIAAVAFLTAGGVPLVVELGVSLDVLLVVLILVVLTNRLRDDVGSVDLDDLKELRD